MRTGSRSPRRSRPSWKVRTTPHLVEPVDCVVVAVLDNELDAVVVKLLESELDAVMDADDVGELVAVDVYVDEGHTTCHGGGWGGYF